MGSALSNRPTCENTERGNTAPFTPHADEPDCITDIVHCTEPPSPDRVRDSSSEKGPTRTCRPLQYTYANMSFVNLLRFQVVLGAFGTRFIVRVSPSPDTKDRVIGVGVGSSGRGVAIIIVGRGLPHDSGVGVDVGCCVGTGSGVGVGLGRAGVGVGVSIAVAVAVAVAAGVAVAVGVGSVVTSVPSHPAGSTPPAITATITTAFWITRIPLRRCRGRP